MDATGWGDVVAVVAAVISASAAWFARAQLKLARSQAASAEASAEAAQAQVAIAHEQVDITRRQFAAEQHERDQRGQPDYRVVDLGCHSSSEVREVVRGPGQTTQSVVAVEARRLRIDRTSGPDAVDLCIDLVDDDASTVALRISGGPWMKRAVRGAPLTVEIIADPGWLMAPEVMHVELLLTATDVGDCGGRWERRCQVELLSPRQP